MSPRAARDAAAGTGRRCPEGEGSRGRGAAGRSRAVWESSALGRIPSLPRGAGPSRPWRCCVKRCRPGWTQPEASALHGCPPSTPETCREPGRPPAHRHRHWQGFTEGSRHRAPQAPPRPTPAALGPTGMAEGCRAWGRHRAPRPHLGRAEPPVRTGTGRAHAGPAPSGSIPRPPYQPGSCWERRKRWKGLRCVLGCRAPGLAPCWPSLPSGCESQAQREPEEGGKCNYTLPDHSCNLRCSDNAGKSALP